MFVLAYHIYRQHFVTRAKTQNLNTGATGETSSLSWECPGASRRMASSLVCADSHGNVFEIDGPVFRYEKRETSRGVPGDVTRLGG